MELDVFISESLKAIIKGMKDTKEFALENGAIINPSAEGSQAKSVGEYHFLKGIEGAKHVTNIEFDIAVTVSNKKDSDIGGKINVYAFSLGSNLKDAELNQTVSRLKFAVKTILPNTNTYNLKITE